MKKYLLMILQNVSTLNTTVIMLSIIKIDSYILQNILIKIFKFPMTMFAKPNSKIQNSLHNMSYTILLNI